MFIEYWMSMVEVMGKLNLNTKINFLNLKTKIFFSISNNPSNRGSKFYNKYFKKKNYIYLPLKIKNKIIFKKIIKFFKKKIINFGGASISMPYKQEVIKYVDKEVVKEVPLEKIVTKIEYICDKTNENELLLKIQELESENQKFSTINTELEDKLQKFSTITEETTKIFHYNQDDKLKLLQGTLLNLKKELSLRDEKLKELENKIKELENIKINQGAVFLKGSNLTQNL